MTNGGTLCAFGIYCLKRRLRLKGMHLLTELGLDKQLWFMLTGPDGKTLTLGLLSWILSWVFKVQTLWTSSFTISKNHPFVSAKCLSKTNLCSALELSDLNDCNGDNYNILLFCFFLFDI